MRIRNRKRIYRGTISLKGAYRDRQFSIGEGAQAVAVLVGYFKLACGVFIVKIHFHIKQTICAHSCICRKAGNTATAIVVERNFRGSATHLGRLYNLHCYAARITRIDDGQIAHQGQVIGAIGVYQYINITGFLHNGIKRTQIGRRNRNGQGVVVGLAGVRVTNGVQVILIHARRTQLVLDNYAVGVYLIARLIRPANHEGIAGGENFVSQIKGLAAADGQVFQFLEGGASFTDSKHFYITTEAFGIPIGIWRDVVNDTGRSNRIE